jgi:hypothetical protein
MSPSPTDGRREPAGGRRRIRGPLLAALAIAAGLWALGMAALADDGRPDVAAAQVSLAGPERLRSVASPAPDGDAIATLQGSAADAFEPLPYRSTGRGMIEPDPAWVASHIVTAEVPLLTGQVRCHRLLVPQLRGALAELEARGLGDLIDPRQYGGCWSPRHILFDPDRNLSLHAWGVAVDLNVAGNGYGEEPSMDPRVVEVFESWGFAWGGHWRVPDGMHFELVEILESPR